MHIKERFESFDKKIEKSFDLVEKVEIKLNKLKQAREDLENYLKMADEKEIKEGLALLRKLEDISNSTDEQT